MEIFEERQNKTSDRAGLCLGHNEEKVMSQGETINPVI
jgi:hypothetical protein